MTTITKNMVQMGIEQLHMRNELGSFESRFRIRFRFGRHRSIPRVKTLGFFLFGFVELKEMNIFLTTIILLVLNMTFLWDLSGQFQS